MNIAYVRVSTAEQNEARQIEGLEEYGIEKWFIEKVSGKNREREQLAAMMDFAREGDTVYVHDWSRLARSTKDLIEIVEELSKKGVNLVSNKEKFDTGTPQGKFMLTVMGAMYEFERANLLERQREGIAIAKAEGKYKGGGHEKKIDEAAFQNGYERYMKREITKSELAKELNISRPTLDKLLKKRAA